MRINCIQNYKIGNNIYRKPTNNFSSNVYFKAEEKAKGNYQMRRDFTLSDLKKLDDVPCVYCGHPMLAYKRIHDFSKKLETAKGRVLFDLLESKEKYLKPVEKLAVGYIKKASLKNPDLDIKGILEKLFPAHLKKLELQQYMILSKILEESKTFSKNDKILVLSQVIKAKHIIKNGHKDEFFRRNKFITGFNTLEQYFDSKENYKKIDNIIKNMPTTHMSEHALIVKYSRKTPYEIGFRLLSPSMSTLEHIRPQSKGGPTDFTNIVLACQHDNGIHSDGSLDPFHDKLQENLPKYVEHIKKVVEMKGIKSLDTYISDLQKRFDSLLSKPFNVETGMAN